MKLKIGKNVVLYGAILFIVVFITAIVIRNEGYKSIPAPAVKPEETKHYRMTVPDYRENDERSDIVDLEEKMAEYKFDGLDNWPRNDMKGWFADAMSNRNNPGIYRNAIRIWPD